MSDSRALSSNKEKLPELLETIREVGRTRCEVNDSDRLYRAAHSIESLFAALQSENERLKREAILAFYNGASATTRRYLEGDEADEAVDSLNDSCERALRRISEGAR